MTQKGKIGALILMTLSALLLALSGKVWMALGLWLMVVYLIFKIERDALMRTAMTYEAKLFFCMEPEIYLLQIEKTANQLLFRQFWQPAITVLSNTALVFTDEAVPLKLTWPFNQMKGLAERHLVTTLWCLLKENTPSALSQAEHLLELKGDEWTPTGLFYQLDHYRHGVEARSDYKTKLLDQTINKGEVYPFHDEFVWLMALTAHAKIAMASKHYEASLKLLTKLRGSEPYNFLFGEINELMGDVHLQLNQVAEAGLFYQTALNFSEGLDREKRVSEKYKRHC